MREPPADLSTDQLSRALRNDYGISITKLTFLPLGHDARAWVYRATAEDADYFVKVRHAVTNRAALVVPHYLVERDVTRVVAPLSTSRGALSGKAGGYALIVYPFVSTRTGMSDGMTDRQWVEYGTTLRAIHDAPVLEQLRLVLRTDSFEPDGAQVLSGLGELVQRGTFEDAGQQLIAEFWRARHKAINEVLGRAVDLGQRLAIDRRPLVLCHADIHTNNVLLDGTEHIAIVDWDETLLAPRERDLMFVVGGIGAGLVSADQERSFFDGYGTVHIDPVALAYYRYAWAVADISSYGEQVFLRPDLGPIDHAESVSRFQSLFTQGSIVSIAVGSALEG